MPFHSFIRPSVYNLFAFLGRKTPFTHSLVCVMAIVIATFIVMKEAQSFV